MSSPDDLEPTAEEHESFYERIADRLATFLQAHPGGDLLGAAYVRGDFFFTRSEEMHAYGERFHGRVPALVGAIRLVQSYLREESRWRVVFPLDEGPEASVVIYAGRIFFGPEELDEARVSELMRLFVEYSIQADQ